MKKEKEPEKENETPLINEVENVHEVEGEVENVAPPETENEAEKPFVLVDEKGVYTIVGTSAWQGQEGKEHEVSGNVANAIISKGMAALKEK